MANPHTSTITNTEDQIRLRAYELYEERGRQDGRDKDDWLQAEEEITRAKHKGRVA